MVGSVTDAVTRLRCIEALGELGVPIIFSKLKCVQVIVGKSSAFLLREREIKPLHRDISIKCRAHASELQTTAYLVRQEIQDTLNLSQESELDCEYL
jgi:hypothetical protein